jgi:transmembrane sensor
MIFNFLTKYLNQSASRKEKEEFDRWIKEKPSRQIEMKRLQNLWNEAAYTKPFEDIDTEADWAIVRQRIGSPYKLQHETISFRSYFVRIAALVLLAFGLSLGLMKIFRTVDKHPSYYTSIESLEKVRNVQLPDGSIVTLNVNSSLRYNRNFNSDSRDIVLQGEAYFEVEHNQSFPFRVYTGNSVVEVTGTRFSIFEDTAYIRVMVLSGSVSFQSSENPAIATIVSKDESGFIFRDNTLQKQHQANINNISWKTGQLVFHKTPVESALQDIAHHFHKELHINTPLTDSLTAQFTEQTLDDILEELRLLTSLTIHQTENIIVVKQ